MSEEELAIFDILTKPRVDISAKEEKQVKKVAKDMLLTLRTKSLVLDWRQRQQARAAVRLCIEEWLDKLPPVYTPAIYQAKCEAVCSPPPRTRSIANLRGAVLAAALASTHTLWKRLACLEEDLGRVINGTGISCVKCVPAQESAQERNGIAPRFLFLLRRCLRKELSSSVARWHYPKRKVVMTCFMQNGAYPLHHNRHYTFNFPFLHLVVIESDCLFPAAHCKQPRRKPGLWKTSLLLHTEAPLVPRKRHQTIIPFNVFHLPQVWMTRSRQQLISSMQGYKLVCIPQGELRRLTEILPRDNFTHVAYVLGGSLHTNPLPLVP